MGMNVRPDRLGVKHFDYFVLHRFFGATPKFAVASSRFGFCLVGLGTGCGHGSLHNAIAGYGGPALVTG
jgi:hypothetical protein